MATYFPLHGFVTTKTNNHEKVHLSNLYYFTKQPNDTRITQLGMLMGFQNPMPYNLASYHYGRLTGTGWIMTRRKNPTDE